MADSDGEIFVNKICALVGRSEVRDLVDVLHFERAGLRVEEFLAAAQRKDAGVSPAVLAWLLSALRLPDRLPEGADRAELDNFARSLERRLRDAARPASSHR